MAMPQLVQQRLLVGSETFGSSAALGSARLLEPVGEERKVVLGRLELILQNVAFGRDRLGLGVGAGDVAQQRRVPCLELLQAATRPRSRLRGIARRRRGTGGLGEQRG